MSKIAIIRIRGKIGVNRNITDTMNMLRLFNKYHCTVVDNTPAFVGMIRKSKDYITWGEIDTATFKLLLEKRGRLPCKKPLTAEYIKQHAKITFEQFAEGFMSSKLSFKTISGLKPFFRLKPPEGGLERKGIKKPYSIGGALGYRKDKINELIRRML